MFLAVTLVFFISLTASYASNVSDNTQNTYNIVEELPNHLDDSLSNKTNISTQNDSDSFKYSRNIFLASGGDEDRPTKLSQSSIIDASKNVYSFISRNGRLPNDVTIENYKFSMPEFMYLLAKTIQNMYKRSNSPVTVKYDVNFPAKPTGTNINGRISAGYYYDYTTRVANFIDKNNIAPNFVRVPLGRMQYQATIYSFVKILDGIKNNALPSAVTLNIKNTSSINKHFPRYFRPNSVLSKELNDVYEEGSIEEYLNTTKNCHVNDESVKLLAIEITKNSKTSLQKATAIFNWVRDKVSYVYYYNTKLGARNTIIKRTGNCVDQAHLLIALSRASGIPARYVHGRATYRNGKTYGHVWAQILVGNTWTVADPSNTKNSFGVINTWTSYMIHRKYVELPF